MVKFAQMPKYEAYKDSGIEWIGEIPAEWNVVRFRDLFKFGRGLTITKADLEDEGIPCINYGEVHSKYGFEFTPKKHHLKCVSEDYLLTNPNSLLEKGDFIFADTSEDIEGSGNFSQLITDDVVFAGYHSVICRPIGKDNYRYLAYCLESTLYRNQVRQQVKGVKVYSITQTILKNTMVWLPSLEEQTVIANFLDQKNAQIDAAIAIKEQQIELLKERKQIIIQQAVTQGLDPNVPMKDSGIEWVGQIPEHWEVIKLKLLTNKIVDGAHFTPTYVDQGVPFLRVTDLTNMKHGKINWEAVRYIPENEHKELIKRANPEIGDVLLSKNGTIGLTKVVDWQEEFSIFVSLCLIKLKSSLRPEYFTAFFNSPIVDMQITFGSSRTSVTNLHLEKIKELLVILPPIEDQLGIVSYIDQVSEIYDPLIDVQRNQIEKFKEYKSTLINSAVTGKIKITPEMLQA